MGNGRRADINGAVLAYTVGDGVTRRGKHRHNRQTNRKCKYI